jgi:hypothetical protein
MIGLLMLLLLAAYVGVVFFAVLKSKKRFARIAIIAIAIAVPFWDMPIGYFTFQNYCDQDGGFHKFSEPGNSKSVYFTYYPGRPERFLQAGIETIEYDRAGVIRRVARSPSGEIISADVARPTSQLRVHLPLEERLPWNVYRQEQVLEQISGAMIARARSYSWSGGWLFTSGWRFAPLSSCHTKDLDKVIALAIAGSTK